MQSLLIKLESLHEKSENGYSLFKNMYPLLKSKSFNSFYLGDLLTKFATRTLPVAVELVLVGHSSIKI